jgi:hypothetical protein
VVENKDMQIEYDMFAEVWKFFKGYYDMQNDPVKWDEIINSSRVIGNKYESQLCNDLLVAVVMELERKHVNESEDSER